MIASYPIPICGDEKILPPTLISGLWYGAFTARSRNPFACCYFKHYRDMHCCYDGCEYLKHFGDDREEQARNYYLWVQTVPVRFWRYFKQLPLIAMAEYVADMIPPLAIANLLRYLDLYVWFKGAIVMDLFAGVCGWLMAFEFMPEHYKPRKWIAVDIDGRRLSICKHVARELGVDIVTIRRDLSTSMPNVGNVDVIVGSPPCHEFSTAKVSSMRDVEHGLALVRRFFEIASRYSVPTVMEEATSAKGTSESVAFIAQQYGFNVRKFVLRDFGAIQYRRERLIAWRV